MPSIITPYGWDGSQFVPMAALWGYSGQYAEHEQNLNTLARDETLTFSVVPAGEVWVITLFSGWANSATPEVVSLRAVIGGTTHYLAQMADMTADAMLVMQGRVVLTEDDYLLAMFEGCGLAIHIHADALGYKMNVT